MSAPIIGTNIKLEVEASVTLPLTISDISVNTAGDSVCTFTEDSSGNPQDGDIVKFSMTSGMSELDLQACRVSSRAGTGASSTFVLEGIDTTGYELFTAGTFTTVLTFATFAKAQSVDAPNPAPAKIDVTTLIDRVKKVAFGLPEAVDGTIGALFNPGGATEAIIKVATGDNTPLAFRITYSDGRKTVMNAYVSGGSGFNLAPNDAAKSTVAFTPLGGEGMVHYAT